MADAPEILKDEKLRDSYPKLNAAIRNSNEALSTANTAKITADTAKSTADTALANSENTQTQLDTIVINGDSSVEAAQARVASDGTTYTTLQDRLNSSDAQLAENADKVKFTANAKSPLSIPTYDGSFQAVHPKVLYFPNFWNGWRYWMAYTPYPGSDDDFENPCIAVSGNGLTWKIPTGLINPLDQPTPEQIAAGAHMSDTHLVMNGNVMECWYRLNQGGVYDDWYRKTSTDGVTWSEREIMYSISGNSQFVSAAILLENGIYKMWGVDEAYNLVYLTSQNPSPSTWTEVYRKRLTFANTESYDLWHPDIIKTDIGYEMLVSCFPVGRFLDNLQELYYSKSVDGVNWEPLTKVLSPSEFGWDSKQIYRSTFLKLNGIYKVFYSAYSKDNKWGIGLAEGISPTKLFGDLQDRGIVTETNSVSINKPKLVRGLAEYGENYTKLVNPQKAEITLYVGDTPFTIELRQKNDGSTALGDLILNALINRRLDFKNAAQVRTNTLRSDDSYNDTLIVKDRNNDLNGFLRLGGMYLADNMNIQAVAGALRWNNTTKKHQGYNGTAWIDLY